MSGEELYGLLAEAAGDPGRPDVERLLAAMRRRRGRRRAATRGSMAVAVLTVGALALTGPLGGATSAGPTRLRLAGDLAPYSSCDALLADLQARAVPLVGPFGFAGGANGQTFSAQRGLRSSTSTTAAGAALPGGLDQAVGESAAAAADAPLAHSSTTDRTRGVDEPDITKTDGRLFLSLRNGVLRVYDAVHPALLGSITLGDSSPRSVDNEYAVPTPTPGLLLVGSRAVVTGLTPLVTRQDDTRGTTTTDVVDLGNPEHPTITRQLAIDGDLVDARLVDDIPRLVVHAAPPALRWFSPADGTAAAQAEARDRNLALLRSSTIADWLPTYALTDGAGHDLGHGQLYGCDAVEHDTAPSDGADLVGVTAFDPAAATAPTGGLAVVGAGNTAYAVGEHLWIATGRHGGGFFGGVNCSDGTFCPVDATGIPGTPSTQLHGFDISDPAHTTELASTTVPGSLHGDDAINEQNGVLSVLLSSGGPEPGQSTQQTTLLDFRLAAGALTRIGTLDDLSTGETLQSARWIGTFAYVVTFRQLDPLLVLDISDPAAPRLRAALPSAETSGYLLQSDTGRLLGIGNAGSGSVLKLYGVDDPDHPALLATTKLAGGSAAGTDPHALLYWRAGRLLFLPSYDGKVSVTTIGRDALTPAFTLSQAAHPGRASDRIDRAVLIGHNAWTVSDRGVLVSNPAGGAEVAWLPQLNRGSRYRPPVTGNPNTTALLAARDFLLQHRDDLDAALAGFRWPTMEGPFCWPIDFFDALGRDSDALALWIVEEDGREQKLTYAQLVRRSDQVATWLAAHGVGKGSRVMLMLGNRAELWESMLAVMKLGAIVLPTTTALQPADLADRVDRARVDVVVTTAEETPKFRELATVRGVCVDGAPEGWLDYRETQTVEPQRFTSVTKATDPLLLYFTSGTTSRPKLVEHTQVSYPVGHLSTMYWLGIKPGDVHLTVASPGWAKHAWSCFFAPFLAQATVFIYNYARFDAASLLGVIRDAGVTTFCAPPTVWRMLIQADLSGGPGSLREVLAAGEPLNPEVITQVEAAWGLTVRDGFGQTETTLQIGNTPGQPVVAGAMGRPLPGIPVVLIDPITGLDADEGELCLDLSAAPLALMTGYQGDPVRAGESMAGGRYHTGDVASRAADGTITYIGRTDDVFKASDYKISPFELESVLVEHPAVVEAAVVPAPDPTRLAVPKAYLTLAAGWAADAATAQAVLQHARDRLAPYLRVRRVEFVTELPKTVSGKIRRVDLRVREEALFAGTEPTSDLEWRDEAFTLR